MKRRTVQKIDYMLIFLFTLAIQCFSLMVPIKLSLVSDNIGDMALPTYLAGLDWSVVVNRSNYYGYGFKWIYFIFFKITSNPAIIYYSIYVLQFVCIAIAGTLLYHCIVQRFYGKCHSLVTLVIILIGACSIGVSTDSEGSLYFCFLFLICMMLHMFSSSKKEIGWSIFLSFWLCYLLTLHERALAVILAFMIIIAFDWIYTRSCLVRPSAFIVSFVVFFFGQKKLTTYIQNLLWYKKVEAGSLNNTTVSISKPLWFLESWEEFKIFLKTLISNTLTAITKSYGLLYIWIFLIVIGVICFLFANKKFRLFYMQNRALTASFLVCVLTAGIIIVGVAQRWGIKIYTGGPRGDSYYYKGMTYARYYKVFVLASCTLGNVLWEKVRKRIPWWGKVCALFALVVSYAYFYLKLYPIMQANRDDSYTRFGLIPWRRFGESNNVLMSMLIVLVFLILYLWSTETKKKLLIIYMIAILLYSSEFFLVKKPAFYSKFDNVASTIQKMEKQIELPEDVIHIYRFNRSTDCNEHTLQFMLPNYALQYGWPEDEEQALVVTTPDLEYYDEESPTDGSIPYIWVDETFGLYVIGEELQNQLSEAGYTMIRNQ